MLVERSVLPVGEVLNQIGRSEIRLPELQRDYVWHPTQVAKLVDSLYRNYPIGSLLFWQAEEKSLTRSMNIGERPGFPFRAPIYLLDGQQRLTSLYRVFSDHPQAQVVFHVEKERFQNQSATTRADPNWIKVVEIVDPNTSIGKITRDLRASGCKLDEITIERRLGNIRTLRDRTFHVETLRGFSYDQIVEIFVRVNSAGRHLGTTDLAMATLSAKWPGVLSKFQKESDRLQKQGYGDLDVAFLVRAFAAVVFGGGLSSWSLGEIEKTKPESLERAWDVVLKGLRHLIPLLRSHLKITRSAPLPSLVALIPLIVLLGERDNKKIDSETVNGIMYWFLIATIRTRYSNSTDTNLGRDISAARKAEPVKELLKNLGIMHSRPEVTPDALAGRAKESPYFFLSLLVAQHNGAKDWWFGTDIVPGPTEDQQIEYHHIHPVATLTGNDKRDINDIANLAFISQKANRKISDKSPSVYFEDLEDSELAAHCVPLNRDLRAAAAFPQFLAERRRLLADGMTDLLERFRPRWLDAVPTGPAAATDNYKLTMVLYGSAWAPGRLVLKATGMGIQWVGSTDMADLTQAIALAATGIDSDIDIAGESVPVQVVEDSVEIGIGPFLVTGSSDEWRIVLGREQATMQPLHGLPPLAETPWSGDRIPLPVTSTD